MRIFLLAALALTPFVATMTFKSNDALAVVYCKTVGVPKGCIVRPVVRPTVVYCKTVGVPKGCVVRHY